MVRVDAAQQKKLQREVACGSAWGWACKLLLTSLALSNAQRCLGQISHVLTT